MKEKNSGVLYGIGVGPGDPELLTLKAYRILRDTKYIAFPGKVKEENRAYNIIAPHLQDFSEKKFVDIYVQMTKDLEILEKNYTLAAEKIMHILEMGEDVALLTLGDPTIYATYMYIHRKIVQAGFTAQIISGVPSFCAAAASLGISLAEREEQLHILPSSYGIEEGLRLPGNKILMKAGSKLGDVKKQLQKADAQVYMVENCSMKTERIMKGADAIDEKAGYLSLLIVKESQGEEQ